MSLIQNTLGSQTFAGLENLTNKKADTSRLPNTAKEEHMTPALICETVELYFSSPFARKHKDHLMLLEEGPCNT